ncbi:MAG TPA: hypothetical protein DF383_01145 [Deltaproteobacteria bacterium]|nr:hypothetical protein [Deltaproteobacteria bacterium]
MSSVWDDPDVNEEDEEVTPLPAQVKELETMTAAIVEKVVREIVPELAERLIRAELERLLRETE